jgi:hypothetical protein
VEVWQIQASPGIKVDVQGCRSYLGGQVLGKMEGYRKEIIEASRTLKHPGENEAEK